MRCGLRRAGERWGGGRRNVFIPQSCQLWEGKTPLPGRGAGFIKSWSEGFVFIWLHVKSHSPPFLVLWRHSCEKMLHVPDLSDSETPCYLQEWMFGDLFTQVHWVYPPRLPLPSGRAACQTAPGQKVFSAQLWGIRTRRRIIITTRLCGMLLEGGAHLADWGFLPSLPLGSVWD